MWQDNSKIRILWKPRWTCIEDDSNLFKYITNFYELLKTNKRIYFVFLEHLLLKGTLKIKSTQSNMI